jgi:DNA-binding ferritin-like protein
LNEQSDQIFAMTDDIAERARKIGCATIRSIGDVARRQRLRDNDREFVTQREMLSELSADNQQLTRALRATHTVCDQHDDVATASLTENWIDEGERRIYMALMIVLWLLILRGIAIEARSHLDSLLWRGFWGAASELVLLLHA